MPDRPSAAPSLTSRLARPAGREDGYVIMVALAMLTIALAIGAAALGETLASRSHANRDVRVKRALQAADAGIADILYRQNELPLKSLEWNGGPLGLSTMLDCVVPAIDRSLNITGVASASVNSAGVCPDSSGPGAPTTGSASFPVGSHAYYQARFIPGAAANGNNDSLNPKIVSVGYDDAGNSATTSGYTVRRVEAILAPLDPFRAIEATGNLSLQGPSVYLLGSQTGSLLTTLNGNARADGTVSLPLLFNNVDLSGGLFGSVTYGALPAPSAVGVTRLSRQTSSFTRSPVSIASAKPSCPGDNTCAALNSSASFFNHYFDSATKTVTVPAGGTITFPAGDYVFCNFTSNGTVMANSTATGPVRIFIDSSNSSRCSGDGLGTNQGNFVANQGVGNLLANTTGVTGASGLQIYVVGDQAAAPNTYDDASKVTIGPNGVVENYVVYAPTSLVSVSNCTPVLVLGSGTDLCFAIQGSIIGHDVTVKALAFTQDLDLSSYPLYSGLGAFHVQQYIECAPTTSPNLMPSPDPTTGC